MSIVNFSVPETVKQAFNRAFVHCNKSQVIADLMMQAVEEQKMLKQRSAAIEDLLLIRDSQKNVSTKKIRVARGELRK